MCSLRMGTLERDRVICSESFSFAGEIARAKGVAEGKGETRHAPRTQSEEGDDCRFGTKKSRNEGTRNVCPRVVESQASAHLRDLAEKNFVSVEPVNIMIQNVNIFRGRLCLCMPRVYVDLPAAT